MESLTTCGETGTESSTKLLWQVWERSGTLAIGSKQGPNNLLRGYSWAALRTNFNVGRLMFDAGLSSNIAADYIFLTHGHCDHSASLYFHTLTENPKDIFVPKEIEEITATFLRNHHALSDFGSEFDPARAAWKIIPVTGGQVFENILHNGIKHDMCVYNNDHSVPCVSFGFKEEKKSLKDEYIGKEGKELGKLRKEGHIIEKFDKIPRFIYIGDTSERVFEMNPEIFVYPDIIVECTFLEHDDLDQATKTKHCHWERLREIIRAHPENRFILYHFSTRYRSREVANFFRADGPNYEPNVFAWISS